MALRTTVSTVHFDESTRSFKPNHHHHHQKVNFSFFCRFYEKLRTLNSLLSRTKKNTTYCNQINTDFCLRIHLISFMPLLQIVYQSGKQCVRGKLFRHCSIDWLLFFVTKKKSFPKLICSSLCSVVSDTSDTLLFVGYVIRNKREIKTSATFQRFNNSIKEILSAHRALFCVLLFVDANSSLHNKFIRTVATCHREKLILFQLWSIFEWKNWFFFGMNTKMYDFPSTEKSVLYLHSLASCRVAAITTHRKMFSDTLWCVQHTSIVHSHDKPYANACVRCIPADSILTLILFYQLDVDMDMDNRYCFYPFEIAVT